MRGKGWGGEGYFNGVIIDSRQAKGKSFPFGRKETGTASLNALRNGASVPCSRNATPLIWKPFPKKRLLSLLTIVCAVFRNLPSTTETNFHSLLLLLLAATEKQPPRI